ncbi:hypothetical protein LL912_00840 [Niabella sp. CC-SYL272]|uniref:hypothetical protein n=1 Tax=Niabella agricola TaxID=2891571 RepID=UPI001F47CEBE|nr:hypothetical protein [Niabella agricola]MCF3107313.1 hypothetical protein [Niabella agricola]
MKNNVSFATIYKGEKYGFEKTGIEIPDEILSGIEVEEASLIVRAAIGSAIKAAEDEFDRVIRSKKYTCKYEKDGVIHHISNDRNLG